MLNNDGDTVKGIGYLTLYAAYVEEAVDNCMHILSEYDFAPPKNLNTRPISQKINYIHARIGLKSLSHELSSFPALLDHLLELFEKRNELIHGRVYGPLLGDKDTLRPGRLTGSLRAISSEEIYSLANDFFSTLGGLNHASYYSLTRYLNQ